MTLASMCLVLLLLASPSLLLLADARPIAVAAYLPEWRYEGANWDKISEHVSQLILFSGEVGADGRVTALDRLPRPELMRQAREATRRHGTQLLLCLGGNGRSAGFSAVVRSDPLRARLVASVKEILAANDLDGIDYNWEYPGYRFDRGYLPDPEIRADYDGLVALLKETRAALGPAAAVTMAYYPDGRQEALLKELGAAGSVDLFHAMTYDQQGLHSTFDFAQKALDQGIGLLPREQLTLGLPFYGRHTRTGDWKSYEDLLLKEFGAVAAAPGAPAAATRHLPGEQDEINGYYYNGVDMIRRKTKLAVERGVGGLMIWEVGQDCRLEEVVHGKDKHVKTCVPRGDDDSLLVAITRAIREAGATLLRPNKKVGAGSADGPLSKEEL